PVPLLALSGPLRRAAGDPGLDGAAADAGAVAGGGLPGRAGGDGQPLSALGPPAAAAAVLGDPLPGEVRAAAGVPGGGGVGVRLRPGRLRRRPRAPIDAG